MTYEHWRKRLANANDPAFLPVAYLDARLNDGTAQFWATEQAALVTELVQWPGGARTIRAIAAAGRKADITGPLKQQVEAWAKARGCTHAFVEGRAGWRKGLPEYRHYQTILVKDL